MLLNYLKISYAFSVRVRYAPSPTGPMHLGAVRTALFNYLFAKHNNGRFIVRIQDTDIERNVPGSSQQILNTLDWLGMHPHQSVRAGGMYGPYLQSERLNLYKEIQNQLLRKGIAYACFCEQDQGKKKISKDKQQNQQEVYDGRCRKLSLEQVKSRIKNGEKYAIRIKSDIKQYKVPNFKDQVYGNVMCTPFNDFILVKKNGYPTYHFANVIDDWKMGITHVIRGVQWLTNTSKHLYLYNMLEAKPPKFMHLPLIFTAEGKKLSKRDPTSPIKNLKEKGYLPEAIINYCGLMGFNPAFTLQQPTEQKQKNKKVESKTANEYYSMQQLSDAFQIPKVRNSPIKSDIKKLNFFNRYYMRKKLKENDGKFIEAVIQFLRKTFALNPQSEKYRQEFLRQVIQCTIERVSYIEEFKQYQYFFQRPNLRSQTAIKDIKRIFGPSTQIQQRNGKEVLSGYDSGLMEKNKKILHNIRLIMVHVIAPEEYSEQKIAQNLSKFLYDNKQFENQDVYHILRLAVTGRKSGVNIVKTCYILGRERVQADLENLSTMCNDKNL